MPRLSSGNRQKFSRLYFLFSQKLIADHFAYHYSSIGDRLAKEIHRVKTNDDPTKYVLTINESIYIVPTTVLEIRQLIGSLKTKDSSGYDQVSNRMLKHWCDAIYIPLTMLCNKSIETRVFPTCMKLAFV